MAWSISKLKDWACPLRFQQKHLNGRPEPKTDLATVGNMVADAMAAVREQYLSTGVIPTVSIELFGTAPAELADKAAGIVNNALANMPNLLPNPELVESCAIEKGMAFDDGWNRCHDDLNQGTYYTDAWEGVYFKCKPDFVWIDTNNILHIEDDKSGWGEYDASQVLTYAFCVLKALQAKGTEISGLVLQYNYLAQMKSVTIDATSTDIEAFSSWLAGKVEEIKGATEFPAVMGAHCEWCGFVDECPAHEKTKQQLTSMAPESLKDITSMEQAIKGGLWLFAAERVIAAAKSKLAEWVKVNGEVELPGTGKKLAMTAGEDWEAKAGEIYEILIAEGLPKSLFFDRIELKKKHIDAILAGAFPLKGKGITAEISAQNKARRKTISAMMETAGTSTPRRAYLDIKNK